MILAECTTIGFLKVVRSKAIVFNAVHYFWPIFKPNPHVDDHFTDEVELLLEVPKKYIDAAKKCIKGDVDNGFIDNLTYIELLSKIKEYELL